MGQSFPERCEVAGIKVEPLPNLCDFLVELCQFLATGSLLSLFVPNRKLPPLHKDLFQLLVLDDDLVDLSETLKTELHSRHLWVIESCGDAVEQMQGLWELEHPHPFQHLQIERVSLLVQSNLTTVLDPVEETVPTLGKLLKFLEEETRRAEGHQLAVELFA